MDDKSDAKGIRKNPVRAYYESIKCQKNFIKSQFLKSFFGKYKNSYLGFL